MIMINMTGITEQLIMRPYYMYIEILFNSTWKKSSTYYIYCSDKAMLNLKYICLPYDIKLLIKHWIT